MPFTIKKNQDGKFCVYKKDTEGNAVGSSLGCSDTKEEAVAQIGAIESEMKRRGKKSTEHVIVHVSYEGAETVSMDGNDTEYTSSVANGDTIYYNGEVKLNMIDAIDTEKAQSIDEYRDMVIEGFESVSDRENTWVVEVYDEFVVAYDYTNKAHYKATYTFSEEGNVVFSDKSSWEEVKLRKEWVTKSLGISDFDQYVIADDEKEEEDRNTPSKYSIKSLGGNRVGGYAVLWGDEEHKDLDEEFFTPDTKDLTHIFDSVGVVPFVVHHAAEDNIVKFVAGSVDIMEIDDTGLWWEAKVKEFEAYKKYVMPMMEKGMAFVSSGTLPRAKRTEKNGFIARWPIAEISATWLPAEYRMLEHPISEVKSAYEKLGIDVDLSDYDEDNKSRESEDTNQGVEKARLHELVNQELVKLNLLQIELGE